MEATPKTSNNQTCKFCGKQFLQWRTRAYSSTSWKLINADGSLHVCSSRKVASVKPASTGDNLISNSKIEQLQNVLKTYIAREIRANTDDTVLEVTDKVVAQATDRVTDQSLKQILQLIKDHLPPKQHEIIVRRNFAIEETISGQPHKNLQLLVDVLSQRLHVMLVGPAGSGKTTAAEQAGKILELPVYTSSMGPATSQWDLNGYRSPDGKYVPGIMRQPFEHGGVLALDEVDNCNPSVLTALNTALANGHYTFPDTVVEKHPDFIVVGSGNTYGRGADRMYVGRNQLDAATLDRFVVIDWDYDEDAEIAWAGPNSKEWVTYIQKVRATAVKHSMRVIISPRASIFGTKLLNAGIAREKVEEMVLWKGISKDDKVRLLQNTYSR